MTEMIEIIGNDFKTFVKSLQINQENMTITKREMEDIMKTQVRLLCLKI